ncbi:MAG: phosphoribosyltransferase family protein [Candidatus Bathyarchaeia archaeon]
MRDATHVHDLKFRLMVIDLLRLAKKRYTYRKLSQLVQLQITVLSRYVKGHVLPSSERAKKIWEVLNPLVGLESELRKIVKFDEQGYFDNTPIIGDPTILEMAAQDAVARFAGKRITKVLTAAVDGIPLATMIAHAISVDLVIAKTSREVGVREFIEETYSPLNSGVLVTFYVPKGSIRKADDVLIVDDVIRTGETQRVLMNIIEKCKAEIAGIYALIAIGDDFIHRMNPPQNCSIETVLRVRPKAS